MAKEQKGQGAIGPGSYWPIRSGERIGPGAKRLGTEASEHIYLSQRPVINVKAIFCA